ncbi:MAG: immunoglobulin-like domain-containing protein, partial [Bdellovibrionota bacterium]
SDLYATSTNSALTITKDGLVGVGTTSPWRTLSVSGTVAFDGLSAVIGTDQSVCIDPTTKELTMQAGDTCAASSARYKHDIESLTVDGLTLLRTFDPVSFVYNDDTSNMTRWGFIAEEMASTSPQLAAFNIDGSVQTINSVGISAVLTKSIQEIDAIIGASSTPEATVTLWEERGLPLFAKSFLLFLEKLGLKIENGLATLKSLVADKITTKELCLEEVCVTKTELQALLQNQNQNAGQNQSATQSQTQSSSSGVLSGGADTEPPVITLLGNNPAEIVVGAVYSDLGASVSDNVDSNLGVVITPESIDTSVSGEHVITFTAMDSAGNVGTTTRMVIVGDGGIAPVLSNPVVDASTTPQTP